ncbi:hypothetical protein C4D60_Mb02t17980 [Musa balbisiana]|uniref:Uncharacterized protein n=1 Tax=Musa balbisiana TaxID=52838 RepID=A0A4S8IDW2_MUSBA|nr:hypothetical protein C4D60_Mb02t17980 [Musa balbisiana]
MRVGEARCVAFAGMKRPRNDGVGERRRRAAGSACTRSWPRKNRSHSGANVRSELVRNRNAILGADGGLRRNPALPPPRAEARVARRNSATSSASSISGMPGSVLGIRIRWARTNTTGIDTNRTKQMTNGHEEIIARSRSCSRFLHKTFIGTSRQRSVLRGFIPQTYPPNRQQKRELGAPIDSIPQQAPVSGIKIESCRAGTDQKTRLERQKRGECSEGESTNRGFCSLSSLLLTLLC